MSTNATGRVARLESSYSEIDLTKPVDLSEVTGTAEDCYGVEWDIRSPICIICADNEMCGIVTASKLRAKVKEIEKVEKYLDVSCLKEVSTEGVKIWLSGKTRTTGELIEKIKELGNTADEVAVVEWIKRFIKNDDEVYTKSGEVHLR